MLGVARALHAQAQGLGCAGDLAEPLRSGLHAGLAARQAQQGPVHLAVEDALHELVVAGRPRGPLLQQPQKRALAHRGHEVYLGRAAGQCKAAGVEGDDAADAVVPEEQLAFLGEELALAVEQAEPAPGAHAAQAPDGRGVRCEGPQHRLGRHQLVTAIPQQAGTVRAGGDHHAPRSRALSPLELDCEAPVSPIKGRDALDARGGPHARTGADACTAQDVEHTVGAVRERVDPPLALEGGEQALSLEPREHGLRAPQAQHRLDEGGLVVIGCGELPVGEVAAAVARCQNLGARALARLEHKGLRALARGGDGCAQARGSAAHHGNIDHRLSSLVSSLKDSAGKRAPRRGSPRPAGARRPHKSLPTQARGQPRSGILRPLPCDTGLDASSRSPSGQPKRREQKSSRAMMDAL